MDKNNWHSKLKEICDTNNYEYIVDHKNIVFFCPKVPSEGQQKEILNIIPEPFLHRFMVGPKASTIHAISILVLRARLMNASVRLEENKLIINGGENDVSINDIELLTEGITKLLEKDGYFKEWTLIHKGQEYYYNIEIAETITQNNKKRDSVISENDILDLQITLNDPHMTWDKLMEVL